MSSHRFGCGCGDPGCPACGPFYGTPEVCDCCGQPEGRCPGCGREHSPALGVSACEECCDDATYTAGHADVEP